MQPHEKGYVGITNENAGNSMAWNRNVSGAVAHEEKETHTHTLARETRTHTHTRKHTTRERAGRGAQRECVHKRRRKTDNMQDY